MAVEEFSKIDDKYVLYGFQEVKETFSDPFEVVFSDRDTNYVWTESELFSSFMVKRDFFDRVGTFDENFDPCWWEDNDMHYRIILLGYQEFG
jgi:GT2 family glycosyltransferase